MWISETIETLRRPSDLSHLPHLTIQRLLDVLSEYVKEKQRTVDLVLIGGLALHAYEVSERATRDLVAEVSGELDTLVEFLRQHRVPADLGENISGWSVVAMPPGYRERTSNYLEKPGLRLRLLDPVDFVVAKLRRGTELDLEDAGLVANRFNLSQSAIQEASDSAIAASPRDTTIFLFKKLSSYSVIG